MATVVVPTVVPAGIRVLKLLADVGNVVEKAVFVAPWKPTITSRLSIPSALVSAVSPGKMIGVKVV
jgi:hypothetical protein